MTTTTTTRIRTDKYGIREAVLAKQGTGYATPDGRFVIVPVIMGDGANNNGGYSPGKREWQVTDTTGVAQISRWGDKSTTIRQRLYEVRGLIARILDDEAAATSS